MSPKPRNWDLVYNYKIISVITLYMLVENWYLYHSNVACSTTDLLHIPTMFIDNFVHLISICLVTKQTARYKPVKTDLRIESLCHISVGNAHSDLLWKKRKRREIEQR